MAILLLGCQSQVIGGGGGGGIGGSAVTTSAVTSTTSGADAGPPPNPNDGVAIAMLRSEVPPTDPDVDTTVGGGPALASLS